MDMLNRTEYAEAEINRHSHSQTTQFKTKHNSAVWRKLWECRIWYSFKAEWSRKKYNNNNNNHKNMESKTNLKCIS